MELKKIIEERRSYRALESFELNDAIIEELANAASLAPSCFNNQPWRYVFAYDNQVLSDLKAALAKGNEWAGQTNLIIAVFTKKELDCVIKDRIYHWFDTGMATGFLILKAWDLGLVAHPIAGFDEEKVKSVLKIPHDMQVLTLLIVGKKSALISPLLSEKQIEGEKSRPERKKLEEIIFKNFYQNPGEIHEKK